MSTLHAPKALFPPRWQRRHWLLALAAVVVCAVQFWGFVTSLRPPRGLILDFSQEWASARNLLNGRPVYTDQEKALADYLGFHRDPNDPADRFFLKVNAHPPTSVLLAVPLAWLDYPDAFLIWNLFSVALFGLSLWLVARELQLQPTLWWLLMLCALVLVCNPFRQQVNQAQLNMVLLALIVGAWACDRQERPGWAGVLVGMATAVKLFPGFLLVYFLLRGRWKAVFAGAASFAVCTALTVLVVGVGTYEDYYREVLPQVVNFRDWWINASLPGLFSKLFDGRSGHVIPLWHQPELVTIGSAVCAVGLVGVLFAAIRGSRTREEQDLTFGLALVTMLLVAPITWDHYYLLLLVPLALLWIRLRRLGGWQWLFLLCVAALWIFPKIILDTILKPGERLGQVATPFQVLFIISYQCYALLGLFLVNAVAVWRGRRFQTQAAKCAMRPDSHPTLPPNDSLALAARPPITSQAIRAAGRSETV
jgi:hypothetical protein